MTIFTASTHSLEKNKKTHTHTQPGNIRTFHSFLYIWPFGWINGFFPAEVQNFSAFGGSRVSTFMSCQSSEDLSSWWVIATHLKNSFGVKICQIFGNRPADTTWKINMLNPKNGGLVLRSNDLQSWKAPPSFSRMASQMYWGQKAVSKHRSYNKVFVGHDPKWLETFP